MPALIKSLVEVRDALSLIAFLSLVLLLAFRTHKVPELIFGLVRDKLTREQFSKLLRRFMLLGFMAFIALVLLAMLAQVLNHMTQPNALTIEDLRRELAKANGTDEQKLHAESQYKLAMDRLSVRDLDGAIQSLQESIKAIPTLTAREMMTYLFRQKRDFSGESDAWESAVKMARERSNALALARLDRISVPRNIPEIEGDHDLIGHGITLPKGGDKYESAIKLSPGFYRCLDKDGCYSWWFTLYLQTGQSLSIKLRTPAAGGLAGAGIYGTNGEWIERYTGDGARTMPGNAGPGSSMREVAWVAPAAGWYFLYVFADPDTVYRVGISKN
jgi:hypothetical protein